MSRTTSRIRTQARDKNKEQQIEISPLDYPALARQAWQKKIRFNKLKREKAGFFPTVEAGFEYFFARLNCTKIMRVWNQYNQKHGQILASGLAFSMFFAITSLLVISLSAVSFFLSDHSDILHNFLQGVQQSAPGLIKYDGKDGLIDPHIFLSRNFLLSAGIISIVVLLWSALGWISSIRDTFRSMFDLLKKNVSFFALKLRDLVTIVVLGLVTLISAVISTITFQLLHTILSDVGIESSLVRWTIQISVFVFLFLLDIVVIAVLYRVAGDIVMPSKARVQTYILAAIALSVLRVLGTTVLGGATRNPVLAVYAIPIGLLIWFNFVSQIYLISAAWGSVSSFDERRKDNQRLDGSSARIWLAK